MKEPIRNSRRSRISSFGPPGIARFIPLRCLLPRNHRSTRTDDPPAAAATSLLFASRWSPERSTLALVFFDENRTAGEPDRGEFLTIVVAGEPASGLLVSPRPLPAISGMDSVSFSKNLDSRWSPIALRRILELPATGYTAKLPFFRSATSAPELAKQVPADKAEQFLLFPAAPLRRCTLVLPNPRSLSRETRRLRRKTRRRHRLTPSSTMSSRCVYYKVHSIGVTVSVSVPVGLEGKHVADTIGGCSLEIFHAWRACGTIHKRALP